ncbi:MAG: hypothetical protein CME06_04975 [Gemmatimonadetes bacterium]|nr:hypothetical protein [Gemmatimonadota bacterium]
MESLRRLRVFSGALHGSRAFTGPTSVMIDICNRCNFRCSLCWYHSPFLEHDDEWRKKVLDFDVLEGTIDELTDLGVQEIQLTGEGEPFMHPRVMDVIRRIKSRRLRLQITSNGSFFDDGIVSEIVDLGVDELSISVWAGTEEGFVGLHPGSSAKTFDVVVENLHKLHQAKRQQGVDLPKTRIVNAICTTNVREIPEMIELGERVGADEIYFRFGGITPGVEFLSLTEEDVRYLKELLPSLVKSREGKRPETNLGGNMLDLLDTGDFDRNYLHGLADQIPCYVGWYFARILVDGTVVPCCACDDSKEMGNISRQRFRDVWNGERYQEFRKRAMGSLDDPYFEGCGCLSTCPHYHSNAAFHGRAPVRMSNRLRRR